MYKRYQKMVKSASIFKKKLLHISTCRHIYLEFFSMVFAPLSPIYRDGAGCICLKRGKNRQS